MGKTVNDIFIDFHHALWYCCKESGRLNNDYDPFVNTLVQLDGFIHANTIHQTQNQGREFFVYSDQPPPPLTSSIPGSGHVKVCGACVSK